MFPCRLSCTFLAAIVAAISLAACSTAPPRDDYQAYVEFNQAQEAARERQFESITATATGCETDQCRTHIAALAALASVSGGGSPSIAPPAPPPPSTGKAIALALIGQLGPLANAAVSWHQSDNSRDIALGQYDFLGGVIGDVVASPALQGPSITVGGDYVSGQQHVGDAIGGDYITGQVGDTVGGDQAGGDIVGGDAIAGDGNNNSGRYNSPDGDSCEGDVCQGTNTPPPADVPPEG